MGRNFAVLLPIAFALAAAVHAAELAGPRVSITRETRLALEVRLDVLGGAAPLGERIALDGRPGQVLSVSRVIGAADPYRVFLAFTPAPDEKHERCRVRVVSTVFHAGRRSVVDRVVNLAPERLGILELWSAPTGADRLVLGLTAGWKDVPVVVPILPGTEPVEFTVEAISRVGDKEQVLEQRHLTGIVGSPVRYAFQHAAPATQPPLAIETGGTLLIELTPEALHDDELELAARVTVEGDPEASEKSVRRDGMVHERVMMGTPVEVKVPMGAEGELVFRITPYF